MSVGDSIPLWRRIPEGGRSNVLLIILVIIPYLDLEILGALQLGFLPEVENIPVIDLLFNDPLWLVALGVFIVIPYVDGEALRLLEIYPEAWEP